MVNIPFSHSPMPFCFLFCGTVIVYKSLKKFEIGHQGSGSDELDSLDR